MARHMVLAAVGLSLAASATKADFQIPNVPPGYTVNVVQMPGVTIDTWKIYALNNDTNVLGITMDYHDETGKGLQVMTVDNGDGTSSANWDGTVVSGGNRGTYVGSGAANKWVTVSESGDGLSATQPLSTWPSPVTGFADVSVSGLANSTGGGVPADSGVNEGLGAQIGQIVYTHGESITLHVQFFPEPVALPFAGLCAGLLVRRRRLVS